MMQRRRTGEGEAACDTCRGEQGKGKMLVMPAGEGEAARDAEEKSRAATGFNNTFNKKDIMLKHVEN